MRETRARRSINLLNNSLGEKIYSQELIVEEFLNFFKKMSAPSSTLSRSATERVSAAGSSLTQDQIQCLNALITRTKVTEAVFGMHSKKAPGPDGYTAAFYQQQWSLVGEDVWKAVKILLLQSQDPYRYKRYNDSSNP